MNTKNKSDGLAPECKRCSVKKSQINRLENFDIRQQYDKKRYKNMRDYYFENAYRYQNNNREKYLNDMKIYRQSEHGKMKYKEYGNHRKHEMYDQEWENCKKFFNYKCACCGKLLSEHYYPRSGKMILFDFHKDHVYHNGRNDIKNCIPLCSDCNNRKKRKSFHEFYNPSNPDYTYERYHQIYLWLRYECNKYILPKRRYKNQTLKARLKEVEFNKNKIKTNNAI